MTWILSGEQPKDWDYVFARIGGENPDGSPRRVTNMFYLREYPMLMKHIESMGAVSTVPSAAPPNALQQTDCTARGRALEQP